MPRPGCLNVQPLEEGSRHFYLHSLLTLPQNVLDLPKMPHGKSKDLRQQPISHWFGDIGFLVDALD
jgi:hypothetical protein